MAQERKHQEIATLSVDNWRHFARKKGADWKKYREYEFKDLVTTLVDLAKEYNWSTWVGSTKNPFSITMSAFVNPKQEQAISIRIDGKTYAYMASLRCECNPNNIPISDFNLYVGNTVNECKEFVWRKLEDFKNQFGTPPEAATHFTRRSLGNREIWEFTEKIVKELNWYQGDDFYS